MLVIVVHSGVVKEGWHVVLDLVDGLLDYVGSRCNESVDLSVRTLTNFEEDDGALADDLIDDES